MNKAEKLTLNAFSAYIKQEPLSVSETLSDGDFSAFMQKAMLHKLLPMAGSALLRSGALNEKQTQLLRAAIIRQVTGQTMRSAQLLKTLQALNGVGGHPLCVKGIVCRSFYPEPDWRLSGDEDLIVPEDDFERCCEELTKLGFVAAKTDKNAFEAGFTHSASGFRIELHNAFFDPKNDFYNTFNLLFDDIFAFPQEIQTESGKVPAPNNNVHLLYLILHAFKHFILAGTGIRQVCDIALFAAAGGFDWQDIFARCAEVNADVFLNAILLIGEEYFGLDLTEIKNACPAWDDTTNIAPLLDDIMSGAVYGADAEERQHSAPITMRNVAAQNKGKSASVLRSVFPPKEKLAKKYPYVEKHPVLLPAAWSQRLLTYLKSGSDTSLAVDIAKKRTELMKQYRIIK